MDRAVCARIPAPTADALFYGEAASSLAQVFRKRDLARARAICDACPVQWTCLRDALQTPERFDRFGVRAGLLPEERATLREGAAPVGRARDEEAVTWLGGQAVPRAQRQRAGRRANDVPTGD